MFAWNCQIWLLPTRPPSSFPSSHLWAFSGGDLAHFLGNSSKCMKCRGRACLDAGGAAEPGHQGGQVPVTQQPGGSLGGRGHPEWNSCLFNSGASLGLRVRTSLIQERSVLPPRCLSSRGAPSSTHTGSSGALQAS